MNRLRRASLLCLFSLVAALSALPAKASLIFVSNEKDDTVSVIDSNTLKLVKTIQVGHRPRGIIITPDFKEIIVCIGDDSRLDVIDTATLKVTRHLDSGSDPELLAIDSTGKTL